jgi:hypothetical protein
MKIKKPVVIMPKLAKLGKRVILGKFTVFGGYRDLRSL